METDKSIVCTAGVNYLHLYPNGDVYRCTQDYNRKMAPMGNILDDRFYMQSSPQPCFHSECDSWCDIDWTSKWVLSDNNVLKIIRAAEWQGMLEKPQTVWRDQEYPNNIVNKQLVIIWFPELLCNYSCAYCGCAAGSHNIYRDFPSASPKLSVEDWISVFADLRSRFDWGIIQPSGGEPFLSEASIPVFELMSDKFLINCYTNMSRRIMALTRSSVKPYNASEGVGFRVVASIHPSSKTFNWDMFLGRALLLKEQGLLGGVSMVAHPEQVHLFEFYKETFDRYDIPFWIQPWVGTDNKGFQIKSYQNSTVDAYATVSRYTSNIISPASISGKNYFRASLSLDEFSMDQEKYNFAVKARNTGMLPWGKYQADIGTGFQIGAKLLPDYSDNIVNSIQEFRVPLQSELPVQEEIIAEFKIDKKLCNSGRFKLVFDVVNEGRFWLHDYGSTVLEHPLPSTD